MSVSAGPRSHSRWYRVLAAACFLTWAVFGSLVSTSGLVEPIRGDLGLSYSEGGFLLSVPFPLITVFAVMGGIFVDRLGVRKVARLGAPWFWRVAWSAPGREVFGRLRWASRWSGPGPG